MQQLKCSITGVTYNVKTSARPLCAIWYKDIFVGYSPTCSMYSIYITPAGVMYAKLCRV